MYLYLLKFLRRWWHLIRIILSDSDHLSMQAIEDVWLCKIGSLEGLEIKLLNDNFLRSIERLRLWRLDWMTRNK